MKTASDAEFFGEFYASVNAAIEKALEEQVAKLSPWSRDIWIKTTTPNWNVSHQFHGEKRSATIVITVNLPAE